MARTILVVDDLSINRQVLKRALCSDYEILEASDGLEAQEVISRVGASLSAVLTDVIMPNLDGYGVLTWMRSDPELSQIPVIIVTGSEDESSRVKALALGASDFIIKPFNADIVRHCLKNSITLREASTRAIAAQKDKLTGLYNRETFFEKAAEMIAAQESGYYIIASFDIDNFKYVNDQYGTAEGDRILKHIAIELQKTFAAVEGLCGRVYGDNFAVLYPNRPEYCEYVKNQRETVFFPPNTRSNLHFSVGRYVVNDCDLPVSIMFDRAYIAKQSIKGRYGPQMAYFDDAMLRAIALEQEIIGQMDKALQNAEFEVWFQPQYNHSTGALIGAEALARWRHPVEGLIPPGVFIPVFEKNGFVYELDKYVWEQVCAHLRKWIDEGIDPLPVSVNISRNDIFMPEMISVLTGLLAKYRIPVELLHLEITESVFSLLPEHLIRVVTELVELGFTVEIDDFGSGYSSLNMLKSVPAQVLKLDMRFLENNDGSQRSGNIIESIVRMTKWLGMSVIAEGVEDKAQADFLKSIGCSYVQGYLYAKPMPASEYGVYIASVSKESQLQTIESVVNLDNNAFWDPRSMDTLIFNSYVGGACIFEYHNKNIELLRATEKYAQLFGSAGMTVVDALKLNLTEHLAGNSYAQVILDLEKSIADQKEVTGEYLFLDLPNCPYETYLRSTMRVIASTGGRHLVYCTNENITAQRQSEKRERLAMEQLRAIMDNVDLGIIATLVEDETARYVFANDYYYAMLGYTKEQFESEVSSPYLTIAPEDRQRVIEQTEKINRVGSRAELIYTAVTREGRKRTLRTSLSIAVLSGIDAPVQLSILRDITEETALQQRERLASAQIQSMMNDMPGGFARLQLLPNGRYRPVYINEGLEKLTGTSHAELMAQYADDALTGIHPGDAAMVREAIAQMMADDKARSSLYRLLHKDGSYIYVTLFGRITKDISGDTFLNIYFSDASEQKKQEDVQKKLLDNLPCGAGIYEFKDNQIALTYQNKSYWALVGLQEEAYPDSAPLSAIHPDDTPIVMNELMAALQQGRDVVCDVRLRHLTQGYRPVRLVGRIVQQETGGFLIFATFTPNDSDGVSYQQLLPLLLSAIMDSTTDLSFAKDKDLRYLCSSRAFANLVGQESASDIVGKTDFDLFPQDMAEQYRRDDEMLLASGKAMIDRMEAIPSADGTPHYSSTSKYILRDGSGQVIGLYGVGRDVTKAVQQDTQLSLLNSSIPGGLATYVYQDGALRIVYCNDGLFQLFGGTRSGFEQRGEVDPLLWVFEEDRHNLLQQISILLRDGTPVDCIFRVHTIGGGYKWINEKAVLSERRDDTVLFSAVLLDITERQIALEKLRMSEEENRLAIRHSRSVVCRYDIATRILAVSPNVSPIFDMPTVLEDVPFEQVKRGKISPETAQTYIAFYERIRKGEKDGGMHYQRLSSDGWRWIEAHFSSVFDDSGAPSSAVISFLDVTDTFERDAAYKKWLQSIRAKDPSTYSLIRCVLAEETVIDAQEGALLTGLKVAKKFSFSERIQNHVLAHILPEDQNEMLQFLDIEAMLSRYHLGQHSASMEFREALPDGQYRWIRLTVDLVEHPHATDVEAYFLFEDIDADKREQLATRERAELDPLTGVYNRATFEEKVNHTVQKTKPNAKHAMLMLDIDGFKQVNDSFGHSVGDHTLIDIASTLHSALRRDDFVGRLGGDEFAVFLADIPSDTVVANKAKQLCALLRKAFSAEVEISGSVGIACTPRNGTDFDMLYKRADAALYYVKGAGKDNYAFYQEDMAQQHFKQKAAASAAPDAKRRVKKRRMLIVDDSAIDIAMLASMFAEEFIVERAKDGNTALVRLKHYGSAISVVLLDLIMPGMDGFAVLKQMQEDATLSSIPVIVVSGDNNRETSLKAIRAGAVDFVTKPVDPDVLRIRVQSALSKAENERLRATNTLLEFQNSEIMRYKTALERSGIVVVENDWGTGAFVYDPAISKHIAGTFDNRKLWRVLLSDFVADTLTVKRMQELVQQLALDRERTDSGIVVQLKTPDDAKHWFRMHAFKVINEFGLTGKIYLTFSDLGAEKPE